VRWPRTQAGIGKLGVIALVAVLGLATALVTARLPAGDGAATPPAGPADELLLDARLLDITDGDTVDVRLDGGKQAVRFYGIDTPEFRAPYGRDARRALESLLAGRELRLRPVEHDQYDRLVAVVLADDASVNEALLSEGLAWAYRSYLGQVPGDERYCELEAEARAARRGLWAQSPDRWVPPWVWRQRQRAEPGAKVPSRDYTRETAADCQAAVRAARERRRKNSGAPASTPSPRPADAAAPSATGAAHPPGCDIKGNLSMKGARIYHLPGSEHYAETRINPSKGERWFCSEDEARAAGWRAARP